MQQTSLLALEGLKDIGKKQRACLDLLRAHRALCNQEIAKLLNWEINRVTPRIKELRSRGKVEEAYRDVYTPTNRMVIYWRAKDLV